MILETMNLPTDMRKYFFNLVLLDLDTMVGETICKNDDDSFTIFINSRLSCEAQKMCFEHALDHVRHDDWSKSDVQLIEYERHKL